MLINMNKFTLVVNAGRSGSTFLEQLLKLNYTNECYIAHEDIPVQVSRPREYNRAYSPERINELLQDKQLLSYLDVWQSELKRHSVVETGWTSYHLCPLLYHIFQDQFQIIVLHRDPISFAFSRANMGNFHKNTFYDDAHEVSPFDKYSIAPEKKSVWGQMNHFEKCMYWWWVVYREAVEFKDLYPQVPCFDVSSKDIFSFNKINEMLNFMCLNPDQLIIREVTKNPLAKFMKESFPLANEWKSYVKHPDILSFANELGDYEYSLNEVESLSAKYRLPEGFFPFFRSKINYWHHKSKLKRLLAFTKA